MNRVRFVGGTIEDLVAKLDAQLSSPLSKDEVRQIRQEQEELSKYGGCLSDPSGMMTDALGRFSEVSERQLPKAKLLCKEKLVDDGRFTIPGCPDMDLVIVIDTTPDRVMGMLGWVETERYLVFLRERGGNGETLDTPWPCYTCNNYESRLAKRDLAGQSPQPVKAHKCWRSRPARPNMVPMLYAKAHGFEDAEDLAKEMRAAWQADREQEVGEEDWGLRMEIPFSPEWQAGYLAAKPNAWSTLGQDQ